MLKVATKVAMKNPDTVSGLVNKKNKISINNTQQNRQFTLLIYVSL